MVYSKFSKQTKDARSTSISRGLKLPGDYKRESDAQKAKRQRNKDIFSI